MMKNRIGIVGGGQLGRMMAFDAKKLGFTVNIIDPTLHSPAGQVSDYQIVAPYNDEEAIRQLAGMSDFLTFEIELANAEILEELSIETDSQIFLLFLCYLLSFRLDENPQLGDGHHEGFFFAIIYLL